MNAFFSRPSVQVVLRYAAAYALFLIFALIALGILFRLRSNAFELCALFHVDARAALVIITWGTYLLALPYLAALAVIESYMHHAAEKRMVLARAGKVLAIETIILLLTFLITLLAVGIPRSL